jgi:hypothetical protein
VRQDDALGRVRADDLVEFAPIIRRAKGLPVPSFLSWVAQPNEFRPSLLGEVARP